MVVFDEIEKAHPDVANILLQILDEGVLTDGQGRQVSFKNTIICLTSNLGSEALYEPGSTNDDGSITDATRKDVLHSVGRFFKPELINRLDELLVFNKLPPSVILDIVLLRLAEVQSRLVPRRIKLDVSEEAKIWLASKGYSETFGARAVQRVIRDKVVTRIATKLLESSIRDGEVVKIAVSDDDIAISSSANPVKSINADDASRDTKVQDEAGHTMLEEDLDEEFEEEAQTKNFA